LAPAELALIERVLGVLPASRPLRGPDRRVRGAASRRGAGGGGDGAERRGKERRGKERRGKERRRRRAARRRREARRRAGHRLQEPRPPARKLESAVEQAELDLAATEEALADPAAWATPYETAKSTARHIKAKRAVELAYAELEAFEAAAPA
jgi:hypothetical protein